MRGSVRLHPSVHLGVHLGVYLGAHLRVSGKLTEKGLRKYEKVREGMKRSEKI